jgi:serine protease Do
VIGINTAIASQSGLWAGYGFAIPINMAKQIALDLIKTGKVNRGYIGVTIRSVDQTEAEALGLDRPRGVRVDNVQKGGAGADAGLKERDVILSVDGHAVDEANQLQALIAVHHAGDHVQLHVWRDGKELEKTVTLKPRPDLSETASNDEAPDEKSSVQEESGTKSTATLENIGLSVRNLTSAEKDKYDVTNGVMITRVAQASEAQDRQLGQNMVITQVGGKGVKTAGDFEKAINDSKGRPIGITVKDAKGDTHWVALRVPND